MGLDVNNWVTKHADLRKDPLLGLIPSRSDNAKDVMNQKKLVADTDRKNVPSNKIKENSESRQSLLHSKNELNLGNSSKGTMQHPIPKRKSQPIPRRRIMPTILSSGVYTKVNQHTRDFSTTFSFPSTYSET